MCCSKGASFGNVCRTNHVADGLTAAPVVLLTVLDIGEMAASDGIGGDWTLGDACTLADAELGLSGLLTATYCRAES